MHWLLACFGVCCLFACDLASGGGVQCSLASVFCWVSIVGWRRQGSGDLERTVAGGRAWLVSCAHIAPPAHGPIAAAAISPPRWRLGLKSRLARLLCNTHSPKFAVYSKQPISIPVNPLNIILWLLPGCKFQVQESL